MAGELSGLFCVCNELGRLHFKDLPESAPELKTAEQLDAAIRAAAAMCSAFHGSAT